MHGLKLAGVELDRKVLADIAMHEGDAFKAIIAQAQGALPAAGLSRASFETDKKEGARRVSFFPRLFSWGASVGWSPRPE